MDITILIDYKMGKQLYEQQLMFQTYTLDKSLLCLMSLRQSGPWTTVPWTYVSTPIIWLG